MPILDDLRPLLLGEASHITVANYVGLGYAVLADGSCVFTEGILRKIAETMENLPLVVVTATVEFFPVNIASLEITANPVGPVSQRQAQVINAAWCAHYWRMHFHDVASPGTRVMVSSPDRVWFGHVYGIGIAGRIPVYSVAAIGGENAIEHGISHRRVTVGNGTERIIRQRIPSAPAGPPRPAARRVVFPDYWNARVLDGEEE